MITDKEYQIIENYLDDYVPNRQVSARDLLKVWKEAKAPFLLPLLDNNLILTKQVSIEKDITIIKEELAEELDYHNFPSAYYLYLNKLDLPNELDQILRFNLITANQLATNRYEGPEVILTRDDKKFKFSSGAKLLKVLSKILDFYDFPEDTKRLYEDYRIKHSQILNEKNIKGELCLSIHPLDYITMSMNECGWRSCMAWDDEGEYRRGTVEMMNSDCVVVAYLKSSVNMSNGWNSKRWRELFIVNRDLILGIKGYPFWSSSLELEVLKWLKELSPATYDDKLYTLEDGRYVIDTDLEIFPETEAMYNDIYAKHNLYLAPWLLDEDQYTINYSGASQCLACGSCDKWFDSESYLACEDCYEVYHCYNCGDPFEDKDCLYEVNGNLYCEYCFDNLPTCFIDGNKMETWESTTLHIKTEEGIIVEPITVNEAYQDDFPSYRNISLPPYGRMIGVIDVDDLTPGQRQRFLYSLGVDKFSNYEGPYYLDVEEDSLTEEERRKDQEWLDYVSTTNTHLWF